MGGGCLCGLSGSPMLRHYYYVLGKDAGLFNKCNVFRFCKDVDGSSEALCTFLGALALAPRMRCFNQGTTLICLDTHFDQLKASTIKIEIREERRRTRSQ